MIALSAGRFELPVRATEDERRELAAVAGIATDGVTAGTGWREDLELVAGLLSGIDMKALPPAASQAVASALRRCADGIVVAKKLEDESGVVEHEVLAEARLLLMDDDDPTTNTLDALDLLARTPVVIAALGRARRACAGAEAAPAKPSTQEARDVNACGAPVGPRR